MCLRLLVLNVEMFGCWGMFARVGFGVSLGLVSRRCVRFEYFFRAGFWGVLSRFV
jgi:hypothetical protein